MDVLTPHLNTIKIPTGGDMVYKDECMFSFDNPVSRVANRLCAQNNDSSFLGKRYGSLCESH